MNIWVHRQNNAKLLRVKIFALGHKMRELTSNPMMLPHFSMGHYSSSPYNVYLHFILMSDQIYAAVTI